MDLNQINFAQSFHPWLSALSTLLLAMAASTEDELRAGEASDVLWYGTRGQCCKKRTLDS